METKTSALIQLEKLQQLKSSAKAKEMCLRTLRVLYEARFLDRKMQKLVRQNKGGTFHLCDDGHELIGAVAALSLMPEKDWGLPYYRDRAFALGLGCSRKDLLASFLAREGHHHSSGRQMPEHFSDKRLRIPCQSSVVGSQFLHAVGIAKAIKSRNKDEVVYVSGGDGSASQGDFHEALNFSCLHKLPVVFVIQDNGWAISVPVEDQTAGGSAAKLARGYEGLSCYEVDGCDFEAVSQAMAGAVKKARSHEGPSLVVAKVPRIGPHSSSDDPKKYKTEEHSSDDLKKDPVPRFENWLLEMGLVTEEEMAAMRDEIKQAIDISAAEADQLPFPSSENLEASVFAPVNIAETPIGKRGEPIVMVDALNHALDEEMARDDGVVVFGQDVAHGKGGVFGVTRDLTAKYGEERCFNTPLAESTIIGLAIGMSLDGFHKPVAEVQFADYLWTGINQLFNELANIYFRSNGEWNCPVVIRMPYGGYIQGGPYHSQSIEAFLVHRGGLKVVVPSNSCDAKRLLKAAIRDPNPVIFLEHKALYRQRMFSAKPEPAEEEILPLGKAKRIHEGEDITLVCYGMTAFMAHEVALKLKSEGISIDVIDLRTVYPYDREMILESVQKTGKLLIAHEASKTCGFGAEIAAEISEKAFSYLDAPIMRLAGLDVMVPYSKDLENAVLPQKMDLERKVRELAAY
ncbi:MAG: thiamine pyrophosphate-dependent enzyme [Simkaniaceae bacterium]